MKRLKELGTLLKQEFSKEIPASVNKEEGGGPTQPVYRITTEKPQKNIRYVVLQEDIAQGQRVESFRILAEFASGSQYPLYQGTCIGHKKICQLQDPFAQQNPLTDDSLPEISTIKVQVTAARGEVLMKEIRLF